MWSTIPSSGCPMNPDFEIQKLSFEDGAEALTGLVELLRDAVGQGASVGFLSPLETNRAEEYWRDNLRDVSIGKRVIFVARECGRIVGTAQLSFAAQQNGQHR